MIVMPMEMVSNAKLPVPEFIGFTLGSFTAHCSKKILISIGHIYQPEFRLSLA